MPYQAKNFSKAATKINLNVSDFIIILNLILILILKGNLKQKISQET